MLKLVNKLKYYNVFDHTDINMDTFSLGKNIGTGAVWKL